MRSSEGVYLDRIDHLRAVAVFLVVFWHFAHGGAGVALLPFEFVPPGWAFPLSLVEEGHSGVALFMVLSGFIFTAIIGERSVVYHRFLINRVLRLGPMLVLVMAPYCLRGDVTLADILRGFVRDGWAADGSWSIMVELHFYLLLPLLLAVPRANRIKVWSAILLGAVLLRLGLFAWRGDVKELATWSLVGRLDDFLLGMILAQVSPRLSRSATAVMAARLTVVAFLLFYHLFNGVGGERLSAQSPLWIVLPTIESIGFAALIFLYSASSRALPPPIGRMLASIGAASYSIYLLHFTVVVVCLRVLDAWGMAKRLDALAIMALSLPLFAICFGFGWLTYRFIEKPILSLRVPYLRPLEAADTVVMSRVAQR